MKHFITEFKTFALRGNVFDLAIGVIIGGAFGKIVSSLVADIIMPPIGYILGGTRFTDIVWTLKPEGFDTQGVVQPAVVMQVGTFVQSLIDFAIVALVIFLAVKAVNRFKRQEPDSAEPAPSKEVILLTEIRDALKR
jgi:large conductance mechanosensitive channel